MKVFSLPVRSQPRQRERMDSSKAQSASVDAAPIHGHRRVIDDASKAVFRVVDDKLETDSPIAKVTTKGRQRAGRRVCGRPRHGHDRGQVYVAPAGAGRLFRAHQARRASERRAGAGVSSRQAAVQAGDQLSVVGITRLVQRHTHKLATPVPVQVLDSVKLLELLEAHGTALSPMKCMNIRVWIYNSDAGLLIYPLVRDIVYH